MLFLERFLAETRDPREAECLVCYDTDGVSGGIQSGWHSPICILDATAWELLHNMLLPGRAIYIYICMYICIYIIFAWMLMDVLATGGMEIHWFVPSHRSGSIWEGVNSTLNSCGYAAYGE